MAVYHWKGIQQNKHAEGDVQAASEAEAKAQLIGQKIIVTGITLTQADKKAAATSGNDNAAQKPTTPKSLKPKNITSRDLMIFTKKLATMVQSGLPILKTLSMLGSQAENKSLQAIINKIYSDVEAGSTLSDAFEKHPKLFDNIYINLLRAGETSGKLTDFLRRLVIQIEKSEKIRSKIKSALTYPIILLLVATAVIVLMLVKVVPVFEQMFSNMGHKLPGPTQLIVDMSRFLQDPMGGGLMLAIVVGTFLGIRHLIKSNLNFRRRFHRLLLKIPLIRDVIEKSTLSKIAMIEGNLSAAGVSVLESLEIIANSTNNTIYREALVEIKTGVAEGQPLSAMYMRYPIFPPTFCQMLAVGEETGNMDDMFDTTARYYEEEFDMMVDRMTELLEPIMIVFMGVTIGFIIVAMYMPIFQVGQTMS